MHLWLIYCANYTENASAQSLSWISSQNRSKMSERKETRSKRDRFSSPPLYPRAKNAIWTMRGHAEWKTGSGKGMGLNCAILINVARSTLHGHPSSAGSFNRVETFRVNYFPVELELHGQGKERGGEGDVFHTLDGEDRRTNGKREKKRFSRISNEKTR